MKIDLVINSRLMYSCVGDVGKKGLPTDMWDTHR